MVDLKFTDNKMKIVVSHVYSNHNKGDAVLLSVLLSDIKRLFSNSEITILTFDKIKTDETFDGIKVKNGFMYYASDSYRNPLAKIWYSIFLVLSTILWAFIFRYFNKSIYLPKDIKNLVNTYKNSDLIITVGGGYIRSRKGIMETIVLFFQIYPIIFSSILNKKTVGYTQSVGPFGTKIQEFIAKFGVKKMSGIIVREKITLNLLKKWGITKNVFLSVDSGFSFKSDNTINLKKELNIPESKKLLGITVRNWLSVSDQRRYEKTIADFCDKIIKKYGLFIVFIPQVTVENHNDDDRESSRRVFNLIENTENVRVLTKNFDHKTIKAVYGSIDYLVGTRFHSVIFAITSFVPSIAIGYEHKTLGIMTDLGLEKWVIDIRNIEVSPLLKLFDELVVVSDDFVSHLKQVLPGYIDKSNKSIYFVKEVYENN